MNKIKLTVVLFAIFPLISFAQVNVDSIKVALSTFAIGIETKDMAVLGQSVAPEFTIHTNTWPSSQRLLVTIWDNQSFESIELGSDEIISEGDYFVADVVFTSNDESKTKNESKVGFNKENKILFVDYFDRLYGVSRYNESVLVDAIPFENDNGSIILTLRLNNSDQPLRFLLDTGANGMAIRKSLADSLGIGSNYSQNASVVGGQQQIEISQGNEVHLSEKLTLKNQNMAIFPTVGHGSDGIIGLNIINHYITSVDYDKGLLSLYTFGKREYEDIFLTLPVKTPYDLILVPSAVNLTGKKEVTGNFIMDTGANYYLILFSKFVRKNRLLLSGWKSESQGSTVSMGISTMVYYGTASEFLLGNDFTDKNIPITLQASTGKAGNTDEGFVPDGSLGVGFLSKFNFVIDLLKNEIHLIKR